MPGVSLILSSTRVVHRLKQIFFKRYFSYLLRLTRGLISFTNSQECE